MQQTRTPGHRVANFAHELLDKGPMSQKLRKDEYAKFLEEAFLTKGLTGVKTSCAMFAGGCLIHAGIQGPRKPPAAKAITTWLGVRGFADPSWIPVGDELELQEGDIFYICGGNANTWKAATNGHVGILIDGSGPLWMTCEGGGGDGTLCRQSEGHKNIYELSRTLRGVWRPELML